MNAYETITNRIMEQLEKGTVPWHKPWKGGEAGRPKNLLSQKEYRGVNSMLLSCCGYDSPYWLTFKQAKEIGAYVRKDEHGVPVIKAIFVDGENKSVEQGHEDRGNAFRGIKVYTVFHISQCELPEKLKSMLDEKIPVMHDPIPAAEKIVAEMPHAPAITHDKAGKKFQAFYSPAQDAVQVPGLNAFEQPEQYYSVLFHELGHSTGHSSRVGRPGMMHAVHFGTTNYSKEELIAEMTAAFLCGMAGIEKPYTIENSAAYIASWLRVLKDDKSFVIQAAKEAQKAADYILGKQVAKSASDQPAKSASEPAPVTVRKPSIPLSAQPYKDSDPLTVFVCKAGGIDPDYAHKMRSGEIRRIRELGKGLPPGTINRGALLTLEEMAEWCFGHGYIYEPSMDAFLEALETDVNAAAVGNKAGRVYSAAGVAVAVETAWQQYNEQQEEASN